MVNASSIVEELEERGVRLEVAEGKLRFHPRSALSEADVARLREFKSLLVEFLLRGPEEEPAEPPEVPVVEDGPVGLPARSPASPKERPRHSERTIDNILASVEAKFGSGKVVIGSRFQKSWQQSARLNIACVNPAKHRQAWRSTFGPHLHCADCSPPFSEDVVAEFIDLDAVTPST